LLKKQRISGTESNAACLEKYGALFPLFSPLVSRRNASLTEIIHLSGIDCWMPVID
jgi:hypothetical protein